MGKCQTLLSGERQLKKVSGTSSLEVSTFQNVVCSVLCSLSQKRRTETLLCTQDYLTGRVVQGLTKQPSTCEKGWDPSHTPQSQECGITGYFTETGSLGAPRLAGLW